MSWILTMLQVLISPRIDETPPVVSNKDGLRKSILEAIFHGDTGAMLANVDLEKTKPYLSYYNRQYEAAVEGQEVHWLGRTHDDILKTIKLIGDGSRSRAEIVTLLQNDPQVQMPGNVLERTLDLSVRLLSMHGLQHWYRPQDIDLSISIRQQVSEAFRGPHLNDDFSFERQFDARALERIAGFEIMWTDDLSQHLSLHDRGNSITVWIYHHAAFLDAMKGRPHKGLLPDTLAEETLRTLALLFPKGDRKVEAWLHHHANSSHRELDLTLLKCDKLLAEQRHSRHFHFWRDRLIVLKQEFDASEPRTIYQWWHDRRKRVQWATFWIAALVLTLTIFFGMVQSVEGALQVYKAFIPTSTAA